MLKLLVIEDHALVREGMVQVLHQLADSSQGEEIQVFQAAHCEDGLKCIEGASDLDLVLLDLALPGIDGLTCLGQLRAAYPALPVVIVSAYDDSNTVNRAIKHGASGFVPKSYSTERLLGALRRVLDGDVFFPEPLAASTATPDAPPATLGKDTSPSEFGPTERQTEVLGLMARGKSNREIADQLGLSEGTVKIHITAIFKALGVSSRTQALVAVARHGIRL